MNTEQKRELRRSKRSGNAHIIGGTLEFFTPDVIVNQLLEVVDDWSDFTKIMLEPSSGDGNIVCKMISNRLEHCSCQNDVYAALETIFSTELMQDNVDIQKSRIFDLIKQYGYTADDSVQEIVNHNIVCTDCFKWDYENWQPKTNELF